MSFNGLLVQPTWLSDREAESFKHTIDIHLSHGLLREVLVWCQSNVEKDWVYKPTDDQATWFADTSYSFYFDNSKDASAFALRWKN